MQPVRIDIWVESSGLGHVTRQRYLASALREVVSDRRLDVSFLVDSNPAASAFVREGGFSPVVRPNDVLNGARWIDRRWAGSKPDLFILDSVSDDLAPEMRSLLSRSDVRSFVVMDDIEDRDVPADLVLNALPGGLRRADYSGRRLRGIEYLIQDPVFRSYQTRPRTISPRAKRGFAFFGGADGNDFTSVFLDVIERESFGLSWTLLLGAMHPRATEILERIRGVSPQLTVHRAVASIAESLWDADVAILNSGNTLADAAALGTPAIVFSQLDIQAANAEYFQKRTGIVWLGGAGREFPHPLPEGFRRLENRATASAALTAGIQGLIGDVGSREAMSKRMRELVDGAGAFRVASELVQLLNLTQTKVHEQRRS